MRNPRSFLWFIPAVALAICASPLAYSETEAACPNVKPDGAVTGLVLAPCSENLEVIYESDGDKAVLKGHYLRENWELTYQGNSVRPTKKGDFYLPVQLERDPALVTLVAVGPLGQTETEKLEIQWKSVKEPKRQSFSVGAGVAYVDYQQANQAAFSESAADLALKYRAALGKRWDLSGEFSGAFLPLNTTWTSVSAFFLSGALDLGYALVAKPDQWRLDAFFGMRYSQAIASNSGFGYAPLLYPELYPEITRTFPGGSKLSLYAKFTPINSFSETELAAGAEWTLPSSTHPFTFLLNYSGIDYTDSLGVAISDTRFVAGVRYGL